MFGKADIPIEIRQRRIQWLGCVENMEETHFPKRYFISKQDMLEI